ncbi:hypothetical protein YC2023_067052 [Brassica napus]
MKRVLFVEVLSDHLIYIIKTTVSRVMMGFKANNKIHMHPIAFHCLSFADPRNSDRRTHYHPASLAEPEAINN